MNSRWRYMDEVFESLENVDTSWVRVLVLVIEHGEGNLNDLLVVCVAVLLLESLAWDLLVEVEGAGWGQVNDAPFLYSIVQEWIHLTQVSRILSWLPILMIVFEEWSFALTLWDFAVNTAQTRVHLTDSSQCCLEGQLSLPLVLLWLWMLDL